MYTIKLLDPRKERKLWDAVAAAQRTSNRRSGASKASGELHAVSGRMFAVAVLDTRGIPVAGARIHVRDNEHPLPVERLFPGDAALRGELESRAADGVAEVGGLWASAEFDGGDIAASLVATAAAHGPLLNARHLIAFVQEDQRLTDVGFQSDERFGEQPDSDTGPVVHWCDTATLGGTERLWRLAILMQRRSLLQGRPLRLQRFAPAPSRAAALTA